MVQHSGILKADTDGELMSEATIKKYLIVQPEGKRQVKREVVHYDLQMIIAVGLSMPHLRGDEVMLVQKLQYRCACLAD